MKENITEDPKRFDRVLERITSFYDDPPALLFEFSNDLKIKVQLLPGSIDQLEPTIPKYPQVFVRGLIVSMPSDWCFSASASPRYIDGELTKNINYDTWPWREDDKLFPFQIQRFKGEVHPDHIDNIKFLNEYFIEVFFIMLNFKRFKDEHEIKMKNKRRLEMEQDNGQEVIDSNYNRRATFDALTDGRDVNYDQWIARGGDFDDLA